MLINGLEHLAIFLGILVSCWALFSGIRAWRKERTAARLARTEQQRVMAEIAAEFKPRNGRTLAQMVAAIDASVKDHHTRADHWFSENADAHETIHRRIDGILELLAGPNGAAARRVADWHHRQREEGASE